MAKTLFEETEILIDKKKDGPSTTLLNVINEHDGIAPKDWPGYRVLTEK